MPQIVPAFTTYNFFLVAFCTLSACPCPFLRIFFFSGTLWCSRPILCFPCPNTGINYFSKDLCFLLSGEWYLDTKIWDLGVLMASEMSLILEPGQQYMCIYIHEFIKIYISVYVYFFILKTLRKREKQRKIYLLFTNLLSKCPPHPGAWNSHLGWQVPRVL